MKMLCFKFQQNRTINEQPIKKAFGGKKLAPNGSRSGNVAPPMVADQEVCSPHLFLTLCLF